MHRHLRRIVVVDDRPCRHEPIQPRPERLGQPQQERLLGHLVDVVVAHLDLHLHAALTREDRRRAARPAIIAPRRANRVLLDGAPCHGLVRHRYVRPSGPIQTQREGHRPFALNGASVGHAQERHARHCAQRRCQQHHLRGPPHERHHREHAPQRRHRTVALAQHLHLQHAHPAVRPPTPRIVRIVVRIEIQRRLRHVFLAQRTRPAHTQEPQPRTRRQHRLHRPLTTIRIALVATQRRHHRRLLRREVHRQSRPTTPPRPQHEQHQQHQHRDQQHQLQRRIAPLTTPPTTPPTPPAPVGAAAVTAE